MDGVVLPSRQGRLKGDGAGLEHPQGDRHHHHASCPGTPVDSVRYDMLVVRVVYARDGGVEDDVGAFCKGGEHLAVPVLCVIAMCAA